MTNERPRWAIRLQSEREARGWNKRDMARELLDAEGLQQGNVKNLARQIRRWENGEVFPREWAAAYAISFNTPLEELFAGTLFPDMDEDRRHLLASLGLLSVSGGAHASALERLRAAFTHALPDDHSVEDWEEIAWEYGHAFLTRTPGAILSDLAADLTALQGAIRRASDEYIRRRLCSPGGKLAALVAMTTATLGDHRRARDWWATARHAADASDDQDLQVWVRGYEAMSSLYARRPLHVVLKRADEAITIAGQRHPCAAVLEAMAARAQALAIRGDSDAAEETVMAMERLFETLPTASADDRLSVTVWPETGLRHTQAFVFTHTSSTQAADRAVDAALSLYPNSMPRQRAQIQLLRAACLARRGDIPMALQHAHSTLDSLDADQQTATIRRGAAMVIDIAPYERAHAPAVAEYRDRLAPPAAHHQG